MKQRQIILAVVVVAVVSAGAWLWRESSEQPEAAHEPAKVVGLQDAFHGPTTASASDEPPPASASAWSQSAPAPASAPEAEQPPVSAQAQPPVSVDTPEPAQRKFARGSRPDESDQN